MKRKRKQRVDTAGARDSLTSSPFASLGGLRDVLPSGGEDTAPEPEPEQPPALARRAVVRFQRKGRGGKEVTLVEKLELSPELMQQWLKELKRGLGCGGTLEGDVLVLQGDQRERLPDLLRKRGVGKISIC